MDTNTDSADAARWYAVAYGDGNDGVSRYYPSFYVYTADPYLLARAAIISEMKPAWKAWAAEHVYVDGEADYGISAVLYEGPGGETAFGAAWLIAEVWPEEPDDINQPNAYDWTGTLPADDTNLERNA